MGAIIKTGIIRIYNQRTKQGWIVLDENKSEFLFCFDNLSAALKSAIGHLETSNIAVEFLFDGYAKTKVQDIKLRLNIADLLAAGKEDEFRQELARDYIPQSHLDACLIIACHQNVDALVSELIERGARCNTPYYRNGHSATIFSDQYNYPLHIAAFHGNSKIVKKLIAHGADCSLRETRHISLKKNTPLHAVTLGACKAKGGDLAPYFEIITMLLEQGADINAYADLRLYTAQTEEKTPLHIAAYYHVTELVKFLLENGAEVNRPALTKQTGKNGISPLHMVFYKGHNHSKSYDDNYREDWQVVMPLLKNKADVHYRYQRWGMCRHEVATPLLLAIASTAPLEVIDSLIQSGADFYSVLELSSEYKRCTPLQYAILHERYDVAELLMQYGAGIGEEFTLLIDDDPSNQYMLNKWQTNRKSFFDYLLQKEGSVLLIGSTLDSQLSNEYLTNTTMYPGKFIVDNKTLLANSQKDDIRDDILVHSKFLMKVCAGRLQEQPTEKVFADLKQILSLHRPQSLVHLCLNFLNAKEEYRKEVFANANIPEELKIKLQF